MTEDTSSKEVIKLLDSDDNDDVRKGLNLVKNTKFSEIFLPLLLNIYMWNSDGDNISISKKIFLDNAPEEVSSRISKQWKPEYRNFIFPGRKSLIPLAETIEYLEEEGYEKPTDVFKKRISKNIKDISNNLELKQFLSIIVKSHKKRFKTFPKLPNPCTYSFQTPYRVWYNMHPYVATTAAMIYYNMKPSIKDLKQMYLNCAYKSIPEASTSIHFVLHFDNSEFNKIFKKCLMDYERDSGTYHLWRHMVGEPKFSHYFKKIDANLLKKTAKKYNIPGKNQKEILQNFTNRYIIDSKFSDYVKKTDTKSLVSMAHSFTKVDNNKGKIYSELNKVIKETAVSKKEALSQITEELGNRDNIDEEGIAIILDELLANESDVLKNILVKIGDSAVEVLYKKLNNCSIKDGKIIGKILVKLSNNGKEKIISSYRSNDISIRMVVAECLGLVKNRKSVSTLIEMLNDKSIKVHKIALNSLIRIGDKSIEPLLSILDQNKIQKYAVIALGEIGNVKALESLKNLQTSNTDEKIKEPLRSALKKLGHKEEEEHDFEQIEKFLLSDDSGLQMMGLSMAKGTGCPEEILDIILKIKIWSKINKNKASATKILEDEAPPSYINRMKKCNPLKNITRIKDREKLENAFLKIIEMGFSRTIPIEILIKHEMKDVLVAMQDSDLCIKEIEKIIESKQEISNTELFVNVLAELGKLSSCNILWKLIDSKLATGYLVGEVEESLATIYSKNKGKDLENVKKLLKIIRARIDKIPENKKPPRPNLFENIMSLSNPDYLFEGSEEHHISILKLIDNQQSWDITLEMLCKSTHYAKCEIVESIKRKLALKLNLGPRIKKQLTSENYDIYYIFEEKILFKSKYLHTREIEAKKLEKVLLKSIEKDLSEYTYNDQSIEGQYSLKSMKYAIALLIFIEHEKLEETLFKVLDKVHFIEENGSEWEIIELRKICIRGLRHIKATKALTKYFENNKKDNLPKKWDGKDYTIKPTKKERNELGYG